MPRPNKPIQPASLTDPVSASRGNTWRKHAGPEFASQYEPDGTILVDPMTHETVAIVDLSDVEAPVVSVGTEPQSPVSEIPREAPLVWTSQRSIEGRSYSRLDVVVPQEVDATPPS
ncbi:MAG: hypothetical protein DWP92_07310 [Armatimonadetes bacterium]|nr:MAG: hypothetical protein DWP92_07310 [Armatimonadota bacterium]